MSGHDMNLAAKEMVTWEKYSYAAVGLCGIMTVYVGYKEYQHIYGHHDHHEEKIEYSHLKIRNKPFPWKSCPNCDLFDLPCWKECKAAK